MADSPSDKRKRPYAPTDAAPMGKAARAYAKREKRLLFAAARERGATVREASKVAGIAEPTGWDWNRKLKEEKTRDAVRSSVASKDEVATVLTQIVRSEDVPPPYRVNAAAQLSKVQGYDAPTRSQLVVHQVPSSVMAWIDSTELAHYDAPDALEPPTAPALIGLGEQASESATTERPAQDDTAPPGTPK